MGWFSSPEPEPETYNPPPRLAPPEFVAALKELKDLYELREKQSRAGVVSRAAILSVKTYFNYGDVDRALSEMRDCMSEAITYQRFASDISDRIRSYEYQGKRPAYLEQQPVSPPPRPEPRQPFKKS